MMHWLPGSTQRLESAAEAKGKCQEQEASDDKVATLDPTELTNFERADILAKWTVVWANGTRRL